MLSYPSGPEVVPLLVVFFAMFALPLAGVPFLAASLASTRRLKLMVAPVAWFAAVSLVSDGDPTAATILVSLAAAGAGVYRTVRQGQWAENLAFVAVVSPVGAVAAFTLYPSFGSAPVGFVQWWVAVVAAAAAMVVLVRDRPVVAAVVVPAAVIVGVVTFDDPAALFLIAVVLFAVVAFVSTGGAAPDAKQGGGPEPDREEPYVGRCPLGENTSQT